MGQGEESDARNGIRNAVCQAYFYGDGDCPSCRRQYECTSMVDETLAYASELAQKRKSDPAGNND